MSIKSLPDGLSDLSILASLPEEDLNVVLTPLPFAQPLPEDLLKESPSLATSLIAIDPNIDREKTEPLFVSLPKDQRGNPVPAEQTNFTQYERAFIQAAFDKVGLPNVSNEEIGKFQRTLNAVSHQQLTLTSSLEELRNAQKAWGGDKFVVNLSQYDLKVLTAGKEQILKDRQETYKKEELITKKANSYTDEAISGFYKLQLNGATSTINDATKIVNAPAIPELPVTGEYWNDPKTDLKTVQAIVNTGAGIIIGKAGVIGTITTAASLPTQAIELVTGKDYRTGQEISAWERAFRLITIGTGVRDLLGPTADAARKLASKLDDLDFGPPSAPMPQLVNEK